MNTDTQIDCAYQKMINQRQSDVGKFGLSAACVIIAQNTELRIQATSRMRSFSSEVLTLPTLHYYYSSNTYVRNEFSAGTLHAEKMEWIALDTQGIPKPCCSLPENFFQ